MGTGILVYRVSQEERTKLRESVPYVNTLTTGAFKLFKCTFPGSKEFRSTFILCFFKNL